MKGKRERIWTERGKEWLEKGKGLYDEEKNKCKEEKSYIMIKRMNGRIGMVLMG